jgi:hypothetical protein
VCVCVCHVMFTVQLNFSWHATPCTQSLNVTQMSWAQVLLAQVGIDTKTRPISQLHFRRADTNADAATSTGATHPATSTTQPCGATTSHRVYSRRRPGMVRHCRVQPSVPHAWHRTARQVGDPTRPHVRVSLLQPNKEKFSQWAVPDTYLHGATGQRQHVQQLPSSRVHNLAGETRHCGIHLSPRGERCVKRVAGRMSTGPAVARRCESRAVSFPRP